MPANVTELLGYLANRQAMWHEDRIRDLAPRKLEELHFHNVDRDRDDPAIARLQKELDLFANRKWYIITRSSRRYVEDWIARESAGRVFLDYACGDGRNALKAAHFGAALALGLDISDVSVRNGRRAARDAGLADRCQFIQGDCESTELPDACVDRIICSGMLHHLDLDHAYRELRRILAPRGKILCVEALNHNPLIRSYRERTPHLRTHWEAKHILTVGDMHRAAKHFRLGHVRYWHLAALASVPFRSTSLFPPMLRAGELLDAIVLRVPGIRTWAWQFTFELLHPKQDA